MRYVPDINDWAQYAPGRDCFAAGSFTGDEDTVAGDRSSQGLPNSHAACPYANRTWQYPRPPPPTEGARRGRRGAGPGFDPGSAVSDRVVLLPVCLRL